MASALGVRSVIGGGMCSLLVQVVWVEQCQWARCSCLMRRAAIDSDLGCFCLPAGDTDGDSGAVGRCGAGRGAVALQARSDELFVF